MLTVTQHHGGEGASTSGGASMRSMQGKKKLVRDPNQLPSLEEIEVRSRSCVYRSRSSVLDRHSLSRFKWRKSNWLEIELSGASE